MRKFFIILILLNLIFIIFLYLNKKYIYIINLEVAMVASLFVTFGSFIGYKRLILKKAKDYIAEDKDYIDKIEDPYNLYEENNIENVENDAKKIFEEEKKRVKRPKEALKNFILTSSGFLSFYRIVGYLLLILSIFILIDKKIFDAIWYLVGLSLVPLSALIFSLFLDIRE